MTDSLHLGVQLATAAVTWPELQDAALRVESLGYDSLWVPDHLVARENDASRFEAWQVLAALATVTTRIRLGPLVSPVTFRHPALLAKMATTLDHISAGRVILGLGAGGMPEEHRQFGLPMGTTRERTERLGEAASLVRSLLDAPVSDFAGKYYQVRQARALPKPLQARLPLLVAGKGDGAIRVAARFADLWNGIGLPPVFGAKVRRLRSEITAAHRDPAAVMATASFRLIIREDHRGIARRLDELSPVWRDDVYRLVGDVPQIVSQMQSYLDAGVRGLIIQMPAPLDTMTLERFAVDIRSRLRVDS